LLFAEANGVCCLCHTPIVEKRWIREHVMPLWLGGADNESNWGPAHVHCARAKTKREAKARYKVIRLYRKERGIKNRRRGRPLPGTIASGWKRTFSGGWVKR
jgi:5-methylcytosine-specific restriction endonuclease McrA